MLLAIKYNFHTALLRLIYILKQEIMSTLGILAIIFLSITFFGMMFPTEIESELTKQD